MVYIKFEISNQKKYRLLKLLRRGHISRNSFKLYRNSLNFVIKESKRLYYSRKIAEIAGNSK